MSLQRICTTGLVRSDRAPQSSEGNGGFSQSSPPTRTHSSRSQSVAPATQHLHNPSFVQAGRLSPWSLCYHWSGWDLFVLSRSSLLHAYPSCLPRQPFGAACGQHVPRSHREDSPPPSTWTACPSSRSAKFKTPGSDGARCSILLIGWDTTFPNDLGNL